MLTTFAMSLSTKVFTAAMRASLVDSVSDWLAIAYPYDIRPTTTNVRVREGADDPVFRVEISETDKRNSAVHQTMVTVAVIDKHLAFEVRKTLRPTGTAVIPRRRIALPNALLTDLCVTVAHQLKVRDAEQLIDGKVTMTSQIVDGESLAAFAEAPSRRLPIVIEHTQGRVPAALATTTLGLKLIGIAHIFHFTTDAAAIAFNEFRREKLLTADCITIIWPTPQPPTQIFDKDEAHVVAPLIEAAASSTQPLMVPQLQRIRPQVAVAATSAQTSTPVPISTTPEPPTPNSQVVVLEAANTQLQLQVDDLARTQGELLENIGGTDLLNAGLVEERDRYLNQLTAVLSMQGSTNWPRTPSEAVARGLQMCPNLIFHERSKTSSDNVQTQNGKRVLESLIELNNIASRLKGGQIPLHMLEIHLRQTLLGFRDGISDTAKHRFSDDYAIDWNGETVYGEPHIACGDIRIHFYVDRVRLQIVVAYVGRHLRDASTH